MKCIHCASTTVSKNGHRRGKQCYICHGCSRQFLESYDSLGYQNSIKEHCLKLYVNGMGFRAIERVTGVNHNTVINWVKQAGTCLPDAPEASEIPEVTQVDELETFVGKKSRLRHYLARLHRKTFCYSKSEEMLRLSIKLLLHYLKYRTVPVPS